MLKSKYLGIVAPVFITLSVVGLSYSLFAPHTKPVSSVSVAEQQSQPVTIDELIRLVNTERAKVGAAPLVLDERLNKSAQTKANDMKTNSYYNHVNPKTGKHGYSYIPHTEMGCVYYSENMNTRADAGTPYANEVVTSWMNSTAHRKAMLDARYDLTGFGISGPYVVEHFCDIN